jgi:hypothetical protein
MSEWLRKSLEEAKINFEKMPSWVRESVRSQQGLHDEPKVRNVESGQGTPPHGSEGAPAQRES